MRPAPAAVLWIAVALAGAGALRGDDAKTLAELRRDYATRYFDPAAHCALAKHLHHAGRRIVAFHVLEVARRARFSPEELDPAFARAFLGIAPIDTSAEAEVRLLEKEKWEPSSIEVVRELANLYVERRDLAGAKRWLARAMVVAPADFAPVARLSAILAAEKDEAGARRLREEFARRNPDAAESWRMKLEGAFSGERRAALALVQQAVEKFPQDAGFLFNRGTLHQGTGDLDAAEKDYVRAAELDPRSAHIQGWTGRFFLKVRRDEARSLAYYLNAYFLDLHFYDSEYAEGRIRALSFELARARATKALETGTPLEKLLSDDDPMVVGLAIKKAEEAWDAKLAPILVELMKHDDPGVRWAATDALRKRADAPFDATLERLLVDEDLFRRGLAAYVLVARAKAAAVPRLEKWLDERFELLRFDAFSSLQGAGEEGKRATRAYRDSGREPSPWLRRLMQRGD